MCFNNSLSDSAQKIESRFNAKFEKGVDFQPIYHASGFSFPKWPVITTEKPNTIQMYQWGLIPHWIKSLEDATRFRANTLNAKSETVLEKPSFRFSIKNKRCLVMSTGFYEWQDINKKKYPYFIKLKNENLFAMAGIYQNWTDSETGELFNTFSILTTYANPLLERIHNMKKRMPVIVSADKENEWINTELSSEKIKSFFTPLHEQQMTAYTISKLITSRSKNSNVPEVQNEYIYEELKQMRGK